MTCFACNERFIVAPPVLRLLEPDGARFSGAETVSELKNPISALRSLAASLE